MYLKDVPLLSMLQQIAGGGLLIAFCPSRAAESFLPPFSSCHCRAPHCSIARIDSSMAAEKQPMGCWWGEKDGRNPACMPAMEAHSHHIRFRHTQLVVLSVACEQSRVSSSTASMCHGSLPSVSAECNPLASKPDAHLITTHRLTYVPVEEGSQHHAKNLHELAYGVF